MRLDRILANSGYGSRTEIKKIIKSGKVTIDGALVKDPGFIVDDGNLPVISIAGEDAKIKQHLHFMMNKPSGVITAMEDRKYETVAKFFPENILLTGIFPVGRLDIDTTGLLIFTNDGTLCHRLTSPKWDIAKEYYLEVSGKYLDETDVLKLKKGLVMGDSNICKSADLKIITPYSGILTIREGKYHQVKKMMKALGGTVTVLKRLSMGPLRLDENLSEGKIRPLTDEEINSLYSATTTGSTTTGSDLLASSQKV